MTTFRQELAKFIQNNLVGSERGITVNETTPLIEQGIVDSMGLMQIVAFIEERTHVRVPDDDVSPENFETIETIDGMVERLSRQV